MHSTKQFISKGTAVKLRVHPAIEHAQAILKSIPERTGKSVEDWAQLLEAAGLKTSKDIVKHLRDQYGVARPTATVLFAKINDIRRDLEGAAYLDYAPTKIDKQYTGGRAHLRSLADAIFVEHRFYQHPWLYLLPPASGICWPDRSEGKRAGL